MKLCLIPHFFVGVYMFSNSSILSSWKYGDDFISEMIKYTRNRYISFERFGNFHTLIFLACVGLCVVFMIVKCALACLTRIFSCCYKGINELFSNKDSISDDFYQEISIKQTFNEYLKTD
jgi:hypothetical protein